MLVYYNINHKPYTYVIYTIIYLIIIQCDIINNANNIELFFHKQYQIYFKFNYKGLINYKFKILMNI